VIGEIWFPGEDRPRIVLQDCKHIEGTEDKITITDIDDREITINCEYAFWRLNDEIRTYPLVQRKQP
jgi:hypothetical protein